MLIIALVRPTLAQGGNSITIPDTNGNQLLNADGTPDGAGAIMTVPTPMLGADGLLSPGESFHIDFVIGLQERSRFQFFVDLYGEIDGVSAANRGSLLSVSFDEELSIQDDISSEETRIFLPIVQR